MNVIEDIFIELESDSIITNEMLERKVIEAINSSDFGFTELQAKRVVSCIVQRDDLEDHLEEMAKDGDINSVDETVKRIESILSETFKKYDDDIDARAYKDIAIQHAEKYIHSIEEQAGNFLKIESQERIGFQERLLDAWGVPLSILEVLIKLTIDVGSKYRNRRDSMPVDEYFTYQALTRIHARACLVSNEILTLMKTGYSEGAIARWRTLHELSIVSLFIRKHGNSIAEKYIDHVEMARIKAGLEFQKHSYSLGYEPDTEEDVSRMKERKNELINKHGDNFKNDYGWASDVLRNKKNADIMNPTFTEIERDVQQEQMKPFSRRASQYIHAGPMGLFYQTGLHPDTTEDLYIARSTNYGIAEPCIYTAYWLNKITANLILSEKNEDGYQYSAYLVTFLLLEDLQYKLEEAANQIDESFNGSYKTTPPINNS